jgi:hypothetical protein
VSLPVLAFAGLCLATLVGFLVYPTYPNYDSYYSLIWGRELVHGIKPSFEAYRAPTEHPLAILFGAALSLLGEGGDRVMVFCTLASFVALAAGLYRLARAAFGPVVGLIAAALICSRFDFPFLAARAYIDIPYLAFIVWAAALEAERPRRGRPVLILLALAALMRPEAWLIIGLYFLWVVYPVSWPRRIEYTALTAIGPAVWAATDAAVTGNPLFSLKHTNGLAEELGRTAKLSDVPQATVDFLKNLDKVPVFYAGLAGVLIAILLTPRRMWMPLVLLAVGVGTFFLVGVAGLSVIDRYLLVPSLMIMVFAALTLGGWSLLTPGRVRTAWMIGAVALVAYGAVFTVQRVNFHAFTNELIFRGDSHRALRRTLESKAVRDGLRCGPLAFGNHKLIPDSRWILDARESQVVARSDPKQSARALRSGVALLATNRSSLLRQALVDPSDRVENNLPPAGFEGPHALSGFYAVFVRCSPR